MHSNFLVLLAVMVFAIMGSAAHLPNRRTDEDTSFLNKLNHIVGRQDAVTVTVTSIETICETGVPAPTVKPEESSHAPAESGVGPTEAPTQVHTHVPPEETHGPAPEETHGPAPEETHAPAPEETHAPAPEETHGPEETHAPAPEETHAPVPEETEVAPSTTVRTSAHPSSSVTRPSSMSTTAHTTGPAPEATSPMAPISGAAYHTGVGTAALVGALGFAALVAV